MPGVIRLFRGCEKMARRFVIREFTAADPQTEFTVMMRCSHAELKIAGAVICGVDFAQGKIEINGEGR